MALVRSRASCTFHHIQEQLTLQGHKQLEQMTLVMMKHRLHGHPNKQGEKLQFTIIFKKQIYINI
jgi:hypothetical protein